MFRTIFELGLAYLLAREMREADDPEVETREDLGRSFLRVLLRVDRYFARSASSGLVRDALRAGM